jgi:hypothetical protein
LLQCNRDGSAARGRAVTGRLITQGGDQRTIMSPLRGVEEDGESARSLEDGFAGKVRLCLFIQTGKNGTRRRVFKGEKVKNTSLQ